MKLQLELTIKLQKVEIQKLSGYQKSYESLKSESIILESKYDIQQTTLEQLTVTYDTLKIDSVAEYNILESKYQLTITELEETHEKYLAEMQQVSILESQLEKLVNEYDTIKEKSKTDKQEFKEKIQSQITLEKQQATEHDNKLAESQSQLDNLIAEYDILKAEYESQQSRLEQQLESENYESSLEKNLKTEYNSIQSKYESLLNELSVSNEGYLQKKNKVNELEIQLEAIINEYNEIKENSEIAKLEFEKETQSHNDQLKQKITEEKLKTSRSRTQLTKLKDQLEKQIDKYFKFKAQSISEKDILDAKHQLVLKDLQKINQKYLAEKQQAKDKVSTLEIKLEKLVNEYDTIKENTAIIQSHLESKVKEQKAQLEQLTYKIESLLAVPDVLIEDSTPPVPEEEYFEEELVPSEITTTPHSPPKKLSWFRASVNKIKKFFGREK